ncbi:GPI mannosyltransferase [Meyerozyma sp. JA9]|nr:GPI mannosyltransferase [Meyerozyma sp. JA9]
MWGPILPFLVVKTIQLTIVWLCPVRFDTSSDVVLAKYVSDHTQFVGAWPSPVRPLVNGFVNCVLKKLVTWDIVYFSDLFVHDLDYEHLFVFCPLWWRWVKYMPPASTNFYTKLFASFLYANGFHLAACISMHFLVETTFGKISMFRSRAKSIALASSLAYVISPAGIFLTAPYSESFCNVLVVTGLWFREAALGKTPVLSSFKNTGSVILYLLSGSLIAISFGVRANSVLFGLFYLYDLQKAWQNSLVTDFILTLAAGGQLAVAIAVSIWYPYSVFCPGRGEWCHSWFPSLFSYAQSKYWGNGLLAYWTPNNIPNFAFAAPTFVLAFWASRYFLLDYPSNRLLPHVATTVALCVGALLFWHVQIITRIASVLPLPYMYMGCLATSPSQIQNQWAKYIAVFALSWIFVQTGLFAGFLPPA